VVNQNKEAYKVFAKHKAWQKWKNKTPKFGDLVVKSDGYTKTLDIDTAIELDRITELNTRVPKYRNMTRVFLPNGLDEVVMFLCSRRKVKYVIVTASSTGTQIEIVFKLKGAIKKEGESWLHASSLAVQEV